MRFSAKMQYYCFFEEYSHSKTLKSSQKTRKTAFSKKKAVIFASLRRYPPRESLSYLFDNVNHTIPPSIAAIPQ